MCEIPMGVLLFITKMYLKVPLCRANIAIYYEIRFSFDIGLTLGDKIKQDEMGGRGTRGKMRIFYSENRKIKEQTAADGR
jgi:hypothetical protein